MGEVLGDLPTWSEEMFALPLLPGSRRALGTDDLPDDLRVLDLDVTQGRGHRARSGRDPHEPARRRWDALSWCSLHRPSWTVLASWVEPEPAGVEELVLDHPAVRDAARALGRTLPS